MATSTQRSRMFPARSRKSYRLEMESRTLYLLLSLMVLTGVVVFYLGLVTGKAMRDPNAPMPLSAEARPTAPAADGDAAPNSLAFNEKLRDNLKKIKGLRVEEQTVTQRTESLLKRGKEMELEEVSPSGATPSAASSKPAATAAPARSETTALSNLPKAPAPRPAAVRPAAPVAPADDGSLYTVQVFSSKYQKNAQELVNRLKNKGFPAYINRYQSAENQVFFRVRVGKTSRSRAEELSSRLKNEANLRNPQITKL